MIGNIVLCPICWTIGAIYGILALFGVVSVKKKRNEH